MKNIKENLKYFINGSIAGTVSRTIIAPIQRYKIIKQVSPKKISKSLVKGIYRLYKNEGFLRLFAGNGTDCLRLVPKFGFQYSGYKYVTRYIKSHFVAGGISGLIIATTLYPLETIRTKLAVQENKIKQIGFRDCCKQIYTTCGARGFYRGLTPCLIGVIPLYSINFGLVNYFQVKFGENTPINNFTAGCLSITAAITVAFPSDLVKKRMQIRGEYGVPNYNNFWECVKDIWRREKIRGFYHGICADYVKMLPANGIFFLTLGLLHKYMP